MAEDFEVGDKVEIIAAGYNLPGTNTRLGHGQEHTITEEDLVRSDIALIFVKVVEGEGAQDASEDDEAMPGMDIDFTSPDYENLKGLFEHSSIKRIKQILNNERWGSEGMEVALEAEAEGKNRESLITWIEGRIDDLKAEEEDFSGEATDGEEGGNG